MNTFLSILIGGAGVIFAIGVAICACILAVDEMDRKNIIYRWGFAITGIVLGIVLAFVFLSGSFYFEAKNDRAVCDSKGESYDREVAFVRHSTWSWDCLMQTDSHGMFPVDDVIRLEAGVLERDN